MDILTDTLNLAGLKSRVLNQRDFAAHTTAQFPCPRSIGFHIVLKGVAYIHASNKKAPITLERGDIALMARGCNHFLSTEEKPAKTAKSLSEFDQMDKVSHPHLTVVSGAYQLWNHPVHPLFRELPDWFILKKNDIDLTEGIYPMMDLLAKESSHQSFGSERVIQSILDVMFSLIIRKVVTIAGLKKFNWSSSIQDEQIRKALELLHQDLAYDWGLDELAKRVGVSRSGLAARFKKLTGDSPLHYLVTLRVQKAIHLLTTSDMNIEQVAFAVGYKDSFTFSKSFKKIAGSAPRDYRRNYLSSPKRGFQFS